MQQSKFNTGASLIKYTPNETIRKETGDYYPAFYTAFACTAQSAKQYKTLNGTQTGDDLLFTSMIDLLFLFLLYIVGSRRIFFLRLSQYFVFSSDWFCANK